MSALDWAAGLFEGEGSVTASAGRRRLQLKMTNEESVRRFHVAVGDLGTVYGPYVHKSPDRYPRRPVFLWVATDDAADRAVAMLFPLVSERRREAMHRLFPDVVGEHPEVLAA